MFQGEELIMQQQPQQVQTHHQIVEEILPEQMSDEVTKEVISQFLPQRKRKPRVPKTSKQNPAKVIKLEPQASGSEQVITSINASIAEPNIEEMSVEKQEQQIQEIMEQAGVIEEPAEQSSSDVKVKQEGKASKDKSNSKFAVRYQKKVLKIQIFQSQNQSHNRNSQQHAQSAQQLSDNRAT